MSLNNPFIVGNLHVLGSIQFADQSVQNSSNTNLTDRVLGISRDSLNGITSINSDNFIVEKTFSVNEKITTPNVLLQNVTFMNDFDENGLPVVQSRGFSNVLRDKILEASTELNSIIPDIIEPPLKKAKLNTAEFTSSNFAVSVNDSSIYLESFITPAQTQVEANLVALRNNNGETASIQISNVTDGLTLDSSSGKIISLSDLSLTGKKLLDVINICGTNSNDLQLEAKGLNSIIFYTGNNQMRAYIDNFGKLIFAANDCYIDFDTGNISGNFIGNLSGVASNAAQAQITSANISSVCYPTFVNSTGFKSLLIDNSSTTLTYTPDTGTLSSSLFAGTLLGSASQIFVTSDNTSGTYYIPFVKTSTSGAKPVFIDDVTGPLTYNASTSTLTCTNFSGIASNATNVNVLATNTTAGTYYPVFAFSPSGNTPMRNFQRLMVILPL